MKRDMDLARRILLATAQQPHDDDLMELPGVDEEDFAQHVIWLQEAGLIKALISDTTGGTVAYVQRLTWSGCDFVDAIQDDTLWAKAKAMVMKPTASFTFEVLKDWLKAEIAQGLPTLRTLGQ
jgi:hypothetical protein